MIRRLTPAIQVTILLILILFSSLVLGQEKMLTFEQTYRRADPQLTKSLPDFEAWLDDQSYLILEDNEEDEDAPGRLVKFNAKTGKKSLFMDFAALQTGLPEDFDLQDFDHVTPDYQKFIYVFENDLFLFDLKAKSLVELTKNDAEEMTPRFSPNGMKVAFTRENDLYIIDLKSGEETRLTHDGSDVIYNGYASWVYYEEILGRRSYYRAFYWSPNSEMIAYLRFDDSPVPEFPIFRHGGGDGVHGDLEVMHYPKPGDHNPFVRLGVVHLSDQKTVWVNTDPKADHYVAWPFWTPDSKQLLFQWMNRGQDHIKLYLADPFSGDANQMFEEKQSAWVEFFEDIHLFKNGKGFILRSDVDGWRHLYYYDMKGQLKARLTQGDWRVRSIELVDEKNKKVYFTASKEMSTQTQLYSVGLKGGKLQKLTTAEGSHRIEISTKGSYFVDTYSSIKHPAKMELRNRKGKLIRKLGDSKLPLMDEYAFGEVELFTIPTEDGYDLPALWTLPSDFDKTKKYPVIFAIYGGPNAGSVSNRWGRLSTQYLAQQGIITITVDHRSSGHFGKKGVALMHRSLGKWEMHDYIEAVKWLRKLPFIDAAKIGITGGSYGGYMTCMALTYGADYFTHGIAGSSVTDWKLYDSVYTERYMDTPAENPEGYKFGSALTHAKKLKGKLRITHGTMDDNVHMQNTIQLIDKFENLDKDFDLMLYPGQRHGIRGPKRAHASRESVQFWLRHFFHRDLEMGSE